MISDLNPYDYNRVRVHYDNFKNQTVTESYFCIHEIIQIEDMEFENFEDKVIS